MPNTPELQTRRLILRKFTAEDTNAVFVLLHDAEVNTFLPWFPVKNLAEAERHLQAHYLCHYLKPESYHYAICLKTDNTPIGYINISDNESHDLGYGLRKEYWHRGIMTEACLAVVQMLRNTAVPFITATHDINNPRSGMVMQRLGMVYRYSYEELVQPKNMLVTFRMYQLNLDGCKGRVYADYWDLHPAHYIESIQAPDQG